MYLVVIKMKISSILLLFLVSFSLFATEQTPDILIYKSDTIFIDTYPLEGLMESDSIIKSKIIHYSDEVCMSSGCWRGHVATWKIENDNLYLIKLVNGCEDFEFKLEKVFEKRNVENGKVLASWYSGEIKAAFGKYLKFDMENWEGVYSKGFNCKIHNGNFTNLIVYEKTDCEIAAVIAQKDFEDSKYAFHSLEFLPVENTYTYVLNKYSNIKWYFTDSLDYYGCYDSIMAINLKGMYGSDFLDKAKTLADSLEQKENWISNAEYHGGQQELMKFILERLTVDTTDMKDGIKTKLYIELEVDSTGKAINPIIRRGIGENTDKKVIEIINEMPNWKPAYLYGQPIRQIYYIPLNINYQ